MRNLWRNTWKFIWTVIALGILVLGSALPGYADEPLITPFSQRVYDEIQENLQKFREDFEAHGPEAISSWGEQTGLTLLTFLDQPQGPERRSPAQGFSGMSIEDRVLVIAGIRYCIDELPGFFSGGVQPYRTGACLSAMGRFLSSGGPNNVLATMTVRQAISNGINASFADRIPEHTGWIYTGSTYNPRSDLSQTQFIMAGLSSVSRYEPRAVNTFDQVRTFLSYNQAENGGQDCYGHEILEEFNSEDGMPTQQMTSAGLWVSGLAGFDWADPLHQADLAWLERWYYGPTNSMDEANQYGRPAMLYGLWAFSKVMELLDMGYPGGPYNRYSFGGLRSPVNDGYPEEPADWYYDVAMHLFARKTAGGSYSSVSHDSANGLLPNIYVVLILERSLGGVCIGGDLDQDLACFGDNCPTISNPDQLDSDRDGLGDVCDPCPFVAEYTEDSDGDGFGDLCDNCPNLSNQSQADQDGDGIGDACDNCPDVSNINQLDRDYNGVGDACDCDPAAVDVCDAYDNDCDGRIDEGPFGETRCETGLAGPCAPGIIICVEGEESCVPIEQPQNEACDLVDNDCDGIVDELPPQGFCLTGNLGECAAGQRACVRGAMTCFPFRGPEAETCDGRDNDCDGTLDEEPIDAGDPCDSGQEGVCGPGVTECVLGELMCMPIFSDREERCDGFDDDCDGLIDEGDPGSGEPCLTDRLGVCREGTTLCLNGSITCISLTEPSDDKCNALDDDCDGAIDELALVNTPCDTGRVGVCAQGLTFCERGVSMCRPTAESSDELCDTIDNDCDGEVDEGPYGEPEGAQQGLVCQTGWGGACEEGQTVCERGQLMCTVESLSIEESECDGFDEDCDGQIDEGLRNACGLCASPATEECNGLDEDCDGSLDEGALCARGTTCIQGECRSFCRRNEECAQEERCAEGLCVPSCFQVTCHAGMQCEDGQCVDPCIGFDCRDRTLRCIAGECAPISCLPGQCPDGFKCKNQDCIPDPCEGILCSPSEDGTLTFCRDGLCVRSCVDRHCPQGLFCVEGLCYNDPCTSVSCSAGEVCVEGQCTTNHCQDCQDSERCIAGHCQPDPCELVRCGPQQNCVLGALGQGECQWDTSALVEMNDAGVASNDMELANDMEFANDMGLPQDHSIESDMNMMNEPNPNEESDAEVGSESNEGMQDQAANPNEGCESTRHPQLPFFMWILFFILMRAFKLKVQTLIF